MQYLLRSVDSQKLDFHAELVLRKLPLILLILGMLLISVSVMGLINRYWTFESSGTAVLLLGAGGVFSSGAWLIGLSVSRQPLRIRFDNEKTRMIIGQDVGFINVAEIQYKEIREIVFRRSSEPGTNNVTQPLFEVLLVTVNLQVWRLGRFSSEEKARAHVEYLSGMIELKKIGQPSSPAVPDSVKQEVIDGKTILRWRNDQRSTYAFSILLLASLSTVLLVIFTMIMVSWWVPFLIFGGIAMLGIYLVFLMVTNWNEIFRVEIGDGEFACFRETGLKQKALRKIGLDRIRSAGAYFEFNYSDNNIMVVEPELFGILENIITGKIGFADSINAFRKTASALKLPASNLSVVDRIRLSEILRNQILKSGGVSVV